MGKDTVTKKEALVAAKKSRPSLTVRQIARIFGISKSAVGRILKEGMAKTCPKCGRDYEKD